MGRTRGDDANSIDLAQSVPEIGRLWTETADLFIGAITAVLERAGVEPGHAPTQASAVGRALCWMIERNFYQASRVGTQELVSTSATCEHIWLVSAGLTTRD